MYHVTCNLCVEHLLESTRIGTREGDALLAHLARAHRRAYRPDSLGDLLALFTVQRVAPLPATTSGRRADRAQASSDMPRG